MQVEVLQTKYLAPFDVHSYTIELFPISYNTRYYIQYQQCDVAASIATTPINVGRKFHNNFVQVEVSAMLLLLLRLFLYGMPDVISYEKPVLFLFWCTYKCFIWGR